MFAKTLLLAACSLAILSTRAHADDSEIDVHSFEYVDVVETSDGSVWKGVIVEQTPGVQYKLASADGSLHVLKAGDVTKISKQKNRDWRGAVATRETSTSTTSDTGDHGSRGAGAGVGAGGGVVGEGHPGDGIVAHDEGSALPAPFAESGLRIDPSFVLVIPAGDISKMDTSFSPSVKFGYEKLFGNIGLEGGGLARFTYWQLPAGEDPNDAAWTLETHAYGRAALHAGRVAFYGGGSLGLDTNMIHIGALNMSKNTMGLGMNVQAGAEVAATRSVAIGVGFDYHPGTDTIIDGAPGSISYYGIHAGASVRM